MVVEVAYLVGVDETGCILEKGDLIIDDRNDRVHSPLHEKGVYTSIGSVRVKAILLDMAADLEKRTPGSEFLERRGDLFFEMRQVYRAIGQLRFTVGDMSIDTGTNIKQSFHRGVFSLIHNGQEGYSFTPYSYEYRDVKSLRLPLQHSMRPEGLVFHSYQYDFSQLLKK